MIHWSKLKNQLLYVENNNTDQLLPENSKFVAMPANESFFFIERDDLIEMYTLDEKSPNYDIKLIKQINVSIEISLSKNPKLTSD